MFLGLFTAAAIFLTTGAAIDCQIKGATPATCKEVIKKYDVAYNYPTDAKAK